MSSEPISVIDLTSSDSPTMFSVFEEHNHDHEDEVVFVGVASGHPKSTPRTAGCSIGRLR
jgi:hypothetical protein